MPSISSSALFIRAHIRLKHNHSINQVHLVHALLSTPILLLYSFVVINVTRGTGHSSGRNTKSFEGLPMLRVKRAANQKAKVKCTMQRILPQTFSIGMTSLGKRSFSSAVLQLVSGIISDVLAAFGY